MKRLLCIAMLMALSFTLFAQTKKVAVYVTGEQTGINKVLGDQLVEAFTRSGKYVAIERTASFLAEISREQSYQRTGAVSDNEIASLGNQFGVQYVCVADVSEVFGEKYISARLIDVESVVVINTANTSSKLQNMDDLIKACSSIATKLSGKTAKEAAAEAAAKAAEEARLAKERENFFKQAMEAGYIRVSNLYVVCDINSGGGFDAAKYCTIGGYKDWRIPTPSELSMIKRQYCDWANEAYKYSSSVSSFLNNLCSRMSEKPFYVDGGNVKYFLTPEGRQANGWETIYNLFVRDIK